MSREPHHRLDDAILQATVATELPALEAAVQRLRERASED